MQKVLRLHYSRAMINIPISFPGESSASNSAAAAYYSSLKFSSNKTILLWRGLGSSYAKATDDRFF
jgi:hypothetical protein